MSLPHRPQFLYHVQLSMTPPSETPNNQGMKDARLPARGGNHLPTAPPDVRLSHGWTTPVQLV